MTVTVTGLADVDVWPRSSVTVNTTKNVAVLSTENRCGTLGPVVGGLPSRKSQLSLRITRGATTVLVSAKNTVTLPGPGKGGGGVNVKSAFGGGDRNTCALSVAEAAAPLLLVTTSKALNVPIEASESCLTTIGPDAVVPSLKENWKLATGIGHPPLAESATPQLPVALNVTVPPLGFWLRSTGFGLIVKLANGVFEADVENPDGPVSGGASSLCVHAAEAASAAASAAMSVKPLVIGLAIPESCRSQSEWSPSR